MRVVVIGAGLGGLAIALRLAHRGHRVTILEKTEQVGGRNREAKLGECVFDGGPTLMMMLDPFRKLFRDVGERMEDHLDITLCDPSYRVFYRDHTRLNATTNTARMIREIEEKVDPIEVPHYLHLLGDLAGLYHESIPNFVRTNYQKPSDLLSPKQLARVLRHGMLGNLDKKISRYVADERLRMLFSFQTMYLGLSPTDAPWVYGTLTYMEYGEGIWYPQGGLPEISRAVARLAKDRGVEIRFQTPVSKIHASAVETESGEMIGADLIISNADMPYTQRVLQQAPPKRKLRYSCSALVMYLDYEGQLPELLHHNIFFGKDFKGNLNSLFHTLQVPEDPAFYACISSRTEPSRAPAGHENLYLLVPCPNLDLPYTPEVEKALIDQVYERLRSEVGFDPSRVRAVAMRTPITWRDELNLEKGAAFGISHDLFQSAFMRPSNKAKEQSNLYYVGASTVPGNGLPMVLISAELVEKRLIDSGVIPDLYSVPHPPTEVATRR